MLVDGIMFNPSLSQVALSYSDKDELRDLVILLKSRGFAAKDGLDDIHDDDHIVGVVVDIDKRCLRLGNVTIMACWCCQIGRPSSAKEFMGYLETHSL